MIVIQCITANFTQIMTWRFTGEDLAEESFPSGCCLQHYANTDTSKMQLTIEEAKGAQSWEKNLLLREILSDGTQDLIELHDCTDIPAFNCPEYKIWKWPSFSVLICWKFAYQQSLKPNDLWGIQLYSSHSVACPTSHLAEGQTQLQLWLYTLKYILF